VGPFELHILLSTFIYDFIQKHVLNKFFIPVIASIIIFGAFGTVYATVGITPHTFELVDQIFVGPYNDGYSTNTFFVSERLQSFIPTQTDLAAIDVPVILGPDSFYQPRIVGVTALLYKLDDSGEFNRFVYGTTYTALPVETGSHTAHLEFAPPVKLTPGDEYGFIISSGASPRSILWEHNDGSAGDLYADGSSFTIQKGDIWTGKPDRLIHLDGDFGFATYYTDPAKGPNSPPEISNLNLDPRDFSRLFCNANVVDPDGDEILPLSYDWIVNSIFLDHHSASIIKGIGTSVIERGDEVSCILHATDGEDSSSQQSETITVENTPPSFFVSTRLTVIDEEPLVFCNKSPFNDADRDTVELLEVNWFVNGEQLLEIPPPRYPGANMLGPESFITHDEVYCEMTATDGFDSVTKTSDIVTIPPPPDTTPPVLTVPDNFTVQTIHDADVVVDYVVTATDDTDTSVDITCYPASGSLFAVYTSSPTTTLVRCVAIDDANNRSYDSFNVTTEFVATIPYLSELVESIELPNGIENSLLSKLDAAQKSLDKENTDAGINQLEAFINSVQALSGKKISETDAQILIDLAYAIMVVSQTFPNPI
jgi:hypothetical protein